MKFKFSWQETKQGEVEIEARNGVEAEKIFWSMSTTERNQKSKNILDTKNTEIKFIDFDWSDSVTYHEWKTDWDLSEEEWEEWKKRFNQ